MKIPFHHFFSTRTTKYTFNKRNLALLTTGAAGFLFLTAANKDTIRSWINKQQHSSDHNDDHQTEQTNNLMIQAEEAPIINKSRSSGKKKLVILGSGWASVSLIQSIDLDLYDVYVVSPRNYFLFTPMLPSALVGTVSMQSITEPIRSVLNRAKKNDQSIIEYFEAECYDVDYANNVVKCKDVSNYVVHHQTQGETASKDSIPFNEFDLKYDKLVVAVGSQPNSFGVKGVDEFSIPMKQPEHAMKIRERLLDVLESSCMPNLTEEEREKALRIVVVGGGFAGIETLVC